jgi:hypothetical protein
MAWIRGFGVAGRDFSSGIRPAVALCRSENVAILLRGRLSDRRRNPSAAVADSEVNGEGLAGELLRRTALSARAVEVAGAESDASALDAGAAFARLNGST